MITKEPIDRAKFISAVTDKSHGAEVFFFGVVRNHHQGKNVLGVSYESFAPLGRTVTLSKIKG